MIMNFTPAQIRQFLANRQGVQPRKKRGTGKVAKDKLKWATFTGVLARSCVSAPYTEYRFHPERKWRFDYAWPSRKIALEVEGGVWTNGRHTRGKGFLGDLEKYNTAAAMGWRVLRVTPSELLSVKTAEMIKKAMEVKNVP